jgi:hypothetical protein
VSHWLDTACRGTFLGLALAALAAHVLLLAGGAVPTWLPLPLLLVGLFLTPRAPLPEVAASSSAIAPTLSPRVTRAIGITLVAVTASITAALVIGAVSTPSRFWDGVVAWDVRTMFLTEQPTLEQPYFRSTTIYAHSRDYPLLQPLLVALGNRALGGNGGRLLFPLLYVLTVATVWSALRRAGVRTAIAAACAAGFAVTPMLVNTTSGGADSGYGELLMASAVLAMANGIVNRLPVQVAAGVVLALFSKPEGLLYGLLPLAVAFVTSDRRLFGTTLAAWLAAAALLLPIQYGLNHGGAVAGAGMWVALASFGVVLLVVQLVAERCRFTARGRLLAVALVVPIGIVALPLFAGIVEAVGGTLREYLGDQQRCWQRLPRVFPVLAGMAEHALFRLRFELVWWCVLVVAVVRYRHRDARERAVSPTAVLLSLGLASIVIAFLLSPEDDLGHHLRSTMSRLLLHWLGVAWLFVGIEWPRPPATGRAGEMSPARSG